jgi:ATP-binding protein involved in chromosome partitioning
MSLKIIQEEKKQHPLSGIKNIIAVAAGKGGVGKTSVAVNLALALKKMGRSVGILDADLYGPSVRRMLPEDRMPQQMEDHIIPALSQGLKSLSMAHLRSDKEATVVRAPIANRMINQFINEVDWRGLDDLIIDFPPGTGDIQLTMCQNLPLSGAVIVTTPQQVAIADVKKAIDMFEQVQVPIIGILENMSYYLHGDSKEKVYIFGREGGKKLAREKGLPMLGQLPLDANFAQYCDEGKNIFIEQANGVLANAFSLLAKDVLGHLQAWKNDSVKKIGNFNLTWGELPNA